jgi:hypothetical protein
MPGKSADGVYGHKPWDKDRHSGPEAAHLAPEEAAFPPQDYIGPFQSNQDRLLNQALATWTMKGSEIQELVRPNLPQINLFPDRYGYTDTEISIEDVIGLPGARSGQRVESDFSNTPNSQQSSSRNTLGTTI